MDTEGDRQVSPQIEIRTHRFAMWRSTFVAMGQGGLAAGHDLITGAGAAVLRNGGNAVDAAIAAVSMACLRLDQQSGPSHGFFRSDHARDAVALAAEAPGPERFLNDFVSAWEDQDEAAFREIVTDDFTQTSSSNQEIGDDLNVTHWTEHPDQTARSVAVAVETAAATPWQVDHTAEVIVTGDGPWHASVQETWDPSSGLTTDGSATSVIVSDADGGLKVASYHHVGREL